MDQGCEKMTQSAPYPQALADLVEKTSYRRGWQVWLTDPDYDRGQGSVGLTLIIRTATVNSYPPHDPMCVDHLFPVPPAAYDDRSWQRWLFEQFLLVERHECMEFFTVAGDKPYAPSHGPGNDPYLVREIGTELDQKTKFTGEISD